MLMYYFTNDLPVSGTLQPNLDPFGSYDGARLWDAFRQCISSAPMRGCSLHLKKPKVIPGTRFDLDTPIDDEDSNLSVGQVRLAPIFLFSRLLIAVR